MQNGWTKYVLRESMKNILPESITWRTDKIGYEPPQNKWIENISQTVNTKMLCEKYNIDPKLILDQSITNSMKWKFIMLNKYENLN